MITKLYCGDCVHLILKRDKNGIVTGEFICRVLNHVRSAFQYTTECSHFFDKSVAPELLEVLEALLEGSEIAPIQTDVPIRVWERAMPSEEAILRGFAALAKARGQ